jgi:hypothetical protein
MKTKCTQFLLVTSAMLVISCSPQRRLEKLLERHPELTSKDTLMVRDTLITPGVTADTSLLLAHLPDTVIIQKEKLRMELVRLHDTLFVSGNCMSDTIIRTLEVPVEKIRLVKPDKAAMLIGKLPWIMAGLIAFSLSLVMVVLKRKLFGVNNG